MILNNVGQFIAWLILSSVIICIAANLSDRYILRNWLRQIFVFALFIAAIIEFTAIVGLIPFGILAWIGLFTAYVMAIIWMAIEQNRSRTPNRRYQ